MILINILCFDVLWPWNWTALSKHSGLEGNGLFSVLFPRRRLCFAHRQAVFVIERRTGVGEAPGSSDYTEATYLGGPWKA